VVPALDWFADDLGLSDTDPVTSWVDFIKGITVTPFTVAPIFTAAGFGSGKAGVAWTLGTHGLQIAAFASGPITQPFSVFVMFEPTTLGINSVLTDGGAQSVGLRTRNTNVWRSGSPTLIDGGTVALSAKVLEGYYNNLSSELFEDAVQVNAGTNGTNSLDGMTIGKAFNGITAPRGIFRRIVVLNSPSSGDRSAVRNALIADL
jgi:hypothetical protein